MRSIRETLIMAGFLHRPGFYAVVDGQYGSTGKGLLSSVLAEHMHEEVDLVTSNAGPNSGHTSYGPAGQKVVLRQLPTFSVMSKLFHGRMPMTYLNAGAIIEPECLVSEVDQYLGEDCPDFFVSRYAAVVNSAAKNAEKEMVSAIGSTGKGTGAALAAKVLRQQHSVFGDAFESEKYDNTREQALARRYVDLGPKSMRSLVSSHGHDATILAEVSQGFSLSLNAGGFYPFCTSRDCTVMQAMSDAGVHPSLYRDCAMVVRTYPIRVAGNSGPCYPDQKEISWGDLGQTPELTTVTQKVRRIFTWSKRQFMDAVHANMPGVVMVNFMNYLGAYVDHREWLMENVYRPYYSVMRQNPKAVLLRYGPNNSDVKAHKG